MTSKITLAYVTSVKDDVARQRIEVTTDRSGHLWMNTDTARETHLRRIRSCSRAHEPITIEFNPSTKEIQQVRIPDSDSIIAISDCEDDPEIVRVQTLKGPMLFSLRKDNPKFEDLFRLLSEAHAEHRRGTRAVLATRLGSNDIEDAMILPAE